MDYVKNRKIFFAISLLVIVVGIFSFVTKGFNYGIDFTGGTIITVKSDKMIEEAKIRELFKEIDNTVSIVYSGEDQSTAIIKSTKNFDTTQLGELKEKFSTDFGVDKNMISTDSTGATIGKEIQRKAIISILISSILMLAYITVRFEFAFGLSAIAALIHDVLITLSFYAIFQFPFNSSLIAAILTILGYSINATIIIFDRIREERKLYPKNDKVTLINNSVNKTLRRSILTTLTTLVAVFTLYFIGVEAVKVLAIPLVVGMLAGTYSSVCLAANFWYIFSGKSVKSASK